jgi:hypothetical protein
MVACGLIWLRRVKSLKRLHRYNGTSGASPFVTLVTFLTILTSRVPALDFVLPTSTTFRSGADRRQLNKRRQKEEIAYRWAMQWRILSGFAMVLVVDGTIGLASELPASVDASEGWKLASESKNVAIYNRAHAGSQLKEFRAIGSIDAPTYTVQAVIDDFENYPKFMPYTTECRLIKRDGDSIVGYQRLSPKICEDRDYTLRVWKKSWPGPDGFTYLDQWKPANDLGPPEKKGVIRLKICDGAWLLEPDGPVKTRATYSVYTDTGGLIPAFIANYASRTGISKLFEAVRKQVKNPKYAADQL